MIIIFGGSFDPVHIGHLILARDVLEHFGADRLIFVPARLSPFKERHSAPAEDRLRMLRLAVESEDGFLVDDIELKREGRSYTVDTLKALSSKYSDRLFFLMGTDTFLSFHRWKSPHEILKLAGLIVMNRGNEMCRVTEYAREFLPGAEVGRDILLYEGRRIEISSTEIRERLKKGLSVRYMVPEGVYEYILRKKLYINP